MPFLVSPKQLIYHSWTLVHRADFWGRGRARKNYADDGRKLAL